MIEAYLPRPDELWFRRKMLADEATMAYNRAYGGTVDFPEERWPDWYGRWVAHPEGRYYRYLRESASGEFVGEIAYHFDGEKYLADVIVYAPYRRRGYGAAGLALLCAAAKETGRKVRKVQTALKIWADQEARAAQRSLQRRRRPQKSIGEPVQIRWFWNRMQSR